MIKLSKTINIVTSLNIVYCPFFSTFIPKRNKTMWRGFIRNNAKAFFTFGKGKTRNKNKKQNNLFHNEQYTIKEDVYAI